MREFKNGLASPRAQGYRLLPAVTLLPGLKGARQSAHLTRKTLALVWKSSRGLSLTLAGLTVGSSLVPLGVAYAGKGIMDAVVARSRPATVRWVLWELSLIVVQALSQRLLSLVRGLLGARLGLDINLLILKKALTLELRHFEDPAFYDMLTRARREASSRPVSVVSETFQLLQNILTLVGYVALLVRFSGWAVVGLVLAALPATFAEMRFSQQAFRLRNWRSPESRQLMYLEYVLANDEHAKEVKLFGLGPLFLDRYLKLGETFFREDRTLAVRRAGWAYLLSLLGTVAFYGCYGVMAVAAAAGRLTLGLMTLYVVAFRQGQQAFQTILSSLGGMYEDNLYMSNLFEFLAIPKDDDPPAQPLPLPSSASEGERGIRFEDVGFCYPGRTEWALRHLDLFIPAGQSLALVGQNGAGKTTLIKLLTRLYRPSEGRLLLDGKDLNAWDERALRRRMGVIFQDFNQYQLKVRENVGAGSVEHLEDDGRVRRAVEQGGAQEVVAKLADGLDTPLGRWFTKGVELSGGQWQKVALARAFMREEADILILDEPTAAVDAEAEHAIFERFRQLAEGKTTILISHRFPTVRMAGRIIVLENGQVLEQGSHAELLAKGGRYAHLFALQAAGYQ